MRIGRLKWGQNYANKIKKNSLYIYYLSVSILHKSFSQIACTTVLKFRLNKLSLNYNDDFFSIVLAEKVTSLKAKDSGVYKNKRQLVKYKFTLKCTETTNPGAH